MLYKQGDIIILPFPFTENPALSKKRPAIIISNNTVKGDNFIVAKITSVIKQGPYSFLIEQNAVDFKLYKKSEIRTDQIFTIHKNIIIRKIGSLNKPVLQELLDKIISHLKIIK